MLQDYQALHVEIPVQLLRSEASKQLNVYVLCCNLGEQVGDVVYLHSRMLIFFNWVGP